MSFDSEGMDMVLIAFEKYMEPCIHVMGITYGACDGWKSFYAETFSLYRPTLRGQVPSNWPPVWAPPKTQ